MNEFIRPYAGGGRQQGDEEQWRRVSSTALSIPTAGDALKLPPQRSRERRTAIAPDRSVRGMNQNLISIKVARNSHPEDGVFKSALVCKAAS